MAKLTIDEANVKMQPVEKAIEGLKSMNLEIPPSLQQEFDRLVKIVTGSANVNVANTFNEKLAPQINKHPEFRDLLASQIGTRCKLVVIVTTAEDGTKTISFEASSSGGGQKNGTSSTGGTKSATPYNHYAVNVIDTPETAGYPEKSGEFETAAKCVEFILNKGNNPFSLGAEFGKGNSMVRVLEGISKNEKFAANFTLDRTYVTPVKKAEVPAEPATA